MADQAFELRRLGGSQEPGREHDRVALAAAPGRKHAGMSVADHVQTGARKVGPRCDPVRRGEELDGLGLDELAGPDDSENRPVRVPVERDAREQPCEEHDREEAIAADEPAEAGEKRGGADQQRPGLHQIDRGGEPAAHGSEFVSECGSSPGRDG